MIEINLLAPKSPILYIGNYSAYFSFFFNKGRNWTGVLVRKTDLPTARPSYYQISKVKDVFLSKDN